MSFSRETTGSLGAQPRKVDQSEFPLARSPASDELVDIIASMLSPFANWDSTEATALA